MNLGGGNHYRTEVRVLGFVVLVEARLPPGQFLFFRQVDFVKERINTFKLLMNSCLLGGFVCRLLLLHGHNRHT